MIEVWTASPEDLGEIGLNLNANDLAEFEAISDLPPELLAAHHTGETSRVVTYKGKPIMACGISPFQGATWSAWMFGTPGSWRAVPRMTEVFQDALGILKARGVKRLEIRTLSTHCTAHAWMEKHLGFSRLAELKDFGRDGQTFYLYERLL